MCPGRLTAEPTPVASIPHCLLADFEETERNPSTSLFPKGLHCYLDMGNLQVSSFSNLGTLMMYLSSGCCEDSNETLHVNRRTLSLDSFAECKPDPYPIPTLPSSYIFFFFFSSICIFSFCPSPSVCLVQICPRLSSWPSFQREVSH